MKKLPLFFILITLFFPQGTKAFLNQADPNNFWQALASAPQVALVKPLQKEVWKKNSQAWILDFELLSALQGSFKSKKLQVFLEAFGQEPVFFKESSPDKSLLVLLAPLPNYALYQDLKKQAPTYRFYGKGPAWFWLADQEKNILQAWLKKQNPNLLIQALYLNNSHLAKEAAFYLEKNSSIELSALILDDFLELVLNKRHDLDFRFALVRLLAQKNSGDWSALKKIAQALMGPESYLALNFLRKAQQDFSEDFYLAAYEQAALSDQKILLKYLATFASPKVKEFFASLLKSSPPDLKKQAIFALSLAKPTMAEDLLLPLVKGDSNTGQWALTALAYLASPKAVDFLKSFAKASPKQLKQIEHLAKQHPQAPALALLGYGGRQDPHGHGLPKKRHFLEGTPIPDPGHSHGSGAKHSHPH